MILDLAHIGANGLTLIEASAGTGKTWTITALYVLLVLEKQLRPEEILVVTYTRAATAELRDRIRRRLAATLDLYATGRAAADELETILLTSRAVDRDMACRLLTRALYSFDDAAIFTIHGFCQRTLQEHAFESGSLFDTDLTADQSALVAQVCADFWRTRIMADTGPFPEWLAAKRHTPETLAAPLSGHYQDPDMRIVPDPEEPDLEALIRQRDRLLSHVAARWRTERDTIIQSLTEAGLSQTSYKPGQIAAAAAKLDTSLADGAAWHGGDGLELFTTTRIEAGMKKGSTRPGHPFFAICQELADAAALVEAGYRTMLVRRQAELHRWLQQELARRKRALNLRSYDDLLLDLQLALARDGGGDLLADTLRGRYQAALIDEFQDTDPLQWRIFARIAGCAPSPPAGEGRGGGEAGSGKGNDATAPYPLFLIGDPKQAIYSFRGADIHAYIAAARSAGPERRQTLQTNRRSAPSLVGAVNTLFSAEDPFHSSDITFTPVLSGRDPDQGVLERGEPVASPFRFWFCRREEPGKAAGKGAARGALITAVATEIARLLAGDHTIIGRDGTVRPLAPEDIAVLVKSHYQADLVQNALTALAIPSVQHGSATIFETTEAMDWLRILRAAAEPGNARLVREALASPCIGLSSDQIFAMQTDEAAWETWALRFQRFRNAADSGAIMTLAALLLGECGGRQRLLALPSGERRLTNFLHCCELLHQAEREHGGGLEGAATWLERRIAAPHGGDETLLRLETDDHAVIISTIHASKGLEYPVVFLPFAWDPPMADARVLFHDDDGSLILDLGTEQRDTVHMAQAAAERDAEAARLFYVAVTRAEFLCYVAWGCINDAFGSPLRRLLHGERFRDAKSFAAASDSDIMADITALADRAGREYGGAPITVSCLPSPEPAPSPRRPAPDTAGLPCHCRVLTHPVPDDWRITSFSGMVAGGERHQQPRDYDAVIPADRPDQAAEPPVGDGGGSIFDFPRGAAAGTCLHELFERLDFARMTEKGVEDICRERLACNGFDPCWLPALQRLVRDVTSAPVLTDIPGFSLSCLKRGSWQAEMEFFLPLAGIDTARMTGLFDGLVAPSRHGPFSEVLETLRIRETRGMLHGFIDLVFEHAGRYYLADWKSNHLGGHREDYLPGELIAPMAGHAYILQYHLYTLALDRLLQLRLPGYRYETHFGGILYLFVRGISADNGECGIYRDRPDPEFIRRAAAILA